MGKRCPNCSEINYDSAVVCSRCKTSLRNAEYISTQNGLATRTPQKNAVEKSSKILISVIVIIAALIVSLVIAFIALNFTDSESKNGTEALADAGEVLQENTATSTGENSNVIDGVNNLPPEDWGEYIAVQGVEMEKTECEISVDDTIPLTAEVCPENATDTRISWYCDDESIATVDEYGNVKGISAGKTTVYATSYDNGVYAKCEIKVTNKNKLVEPDSLADYGRYIVKADTYLSLRYGPSTEYQEISRIDDKQVVTVYAYQNDENSNTWAYVKYKSKFGWVFDNFLLSEAQNSQTTTETEDSDDE